MICPNCQSENKDGAKFCNDCGFPLTGRMAAVAAASTSDATLRSIAADDGPEDAQAGDSDPDFEGAASAVEPESAGEPDASGPLDRSSIPAIDVAGVNVDENGNIVYLGRKDAEVKVRGHRVDLGEIEGVLLENDIVSTAVLNKIDSMWDELKSPAAVDAEIAGQVDASARTLALPAEQIFPVSAQKALVAKINGDDALLERSRLPELELALSNELIPAKQDIVRDNTDAEFSDIYMRSRGLLESRLSGLREQLGELNELRGKNKGVVEYMMGKVRVEKEEFESGLQRYYAVRSVFSQMTNKLFGHLGLDALRQLTASTREAMHEATFSKTLSAAMKNFFNVARANLDNSEDEINEILSMMEAIYKKFAVEHGLKLGTPTSFSLIRHQQEVQRLEQWCDTHLNTMFQLMTHEKNKVTQKFFEEVASQVRRAFDKANHDAESWLKAIMAPMETQVREHQIQLKRRLESIKRIHQATETLEERINELLHVENQLTSQIRAIESAAQAVQHILNRRLGQQALRDAA